MISVTHLTALFVGLVFGFLGAIIAFGIALMIMERKKED